MAQAAQSSLLPPVRKQAPADGESQANQPDPATKKRDGTQTRLYENGLGHLWLAGRAAASEVTARSKRGKCAEAGDRSHLLSALVCARLRSPLRRHRVASFGDIALGQPFVPLVDYVALAIGLVALLPRRTREWPHHGLGHIMVNQARLFELIPVGTGPQLPPITALVLAFGESLLKRFHAGVKARVRVTEDGFSSVARCRPGPGMIRTRFQGDHPEVSPVRVPAFDVLPTQVGRYDLRTSCVGFDQSTSRRRVDEKNLVETRDNAAVELRS